MIIAELSIISVGAGIPSVSKYAAAVFKELKKMNLNPKLNGMCTEFEAADIKTICKAFQKAYGAVFREGAKKAITALKIDERKDKKSSLKEKILDVKNKLQ